MGSAPTSEFSFGSVGLMVGAPDPMMNFPGGTRFSVYAALRNASDHELNVKPVAFLMQGAKPRKVELAEQHLAPNEVRQLSLGSAFSNFDGIATLTFSSERPSVSVEVIDLIHRQPPSSLCLDDRRSQLLILHNDIRFWNRSDWYASA
jgi:hypothetical protein